MLIGSWRYRAPLGAMSPSSSLFPPEQHPPEQHLGDNIKEYPKKSNQLMVRVNQPYRWITNSNVRN
jgi:hypothetical protein